MSIAAAILNLKADPAVYGIEPSASVLDAVSPMPQKNIGALRVGESEQLEHHSAGRRG